MDNDIFVRDFARFERVLVEGIPMSGVHQLLVSKESQGCTVVRSDFVTCILECRSLSTWREFLWNSVERWEYGGLFVGGDTVWYHGGIWSFLAYLEAARRLELIDGMLYRQMRYEIRKILEVLVKPDLVLVFEGVVNSSPLGRDFAPIVEGHLNIWSCMMGTLGVQVVTLPAMPRDSREHAQWLQQTHALIDAQNPKDILPKVFNNF